MTLIPKAVRIEGQVRNKPKTNGFRKKSKTSENH